jgi:D-alanyl-D-alanine carboxypeptidase
MTLYLTFKALEENILHLDQKLPVSKHASRQAPSKLGLNPGSSISVRQAVLALVTKSANDAAVVLAETLGKGSEAHFASLMTHHAHQLGMPNTVFKNASGLPHKHQITTARDMATLSRALYKHFPDYFKVFKEQKFAYKGQVHANHNHLLEIINVLLPLFWEGNPSKPVTKKWNTFWKPPMQNFQTEKINMPPWMT